MARGMRAAGGQGAGGDHLGAGSRGQGGPAGLLPPPRNAAGRPELLRRRRARASAWTRRSAPATRRRGRPAWRCSPAALGIALLRAAVPARHRRLLVRLPGRQVRRVRQRPADVVGAGPGHQAGRAVPGVVRQPAQVRPHRPPRRSPPCRCSPCTRGAPRRDSAAAASHTAAAATPLVTREALFAQAGIIATRDIGELLEAAALLASQPVPARRPGRHRVQRRRRRGAGRRRLHRRGPARRHARRPGPGGAPAAAAARRRTSPARSIPPRRRARCLPPLPGTGRGRRWRGRHPGAHRAHRYRRSGPVACSAEIAKPLVLSVLRPGRNGPAAARATGGPRPGPRLRLPRERRPRAGATPAGMAPGGPASPASVPEFGDLRADDAPGAHHRLPGALTGGRLAGPGRDR